MSLSQVGRALVELGVGSIVAGSPEAKGRIERLWGTIQHRLVVRLERVLVFKCRLKVARNHTIRLAGRVLQLPRGTGPSNYTGKRVEVHIRANG